MFEVYCDINGSSEFEVQFLFHLSRILTALSNPIEKNSHGT